MRQRVVLGIVGLCALAAAASARPALFDFESNSASAPTFGPFPGGYSSLSDSDQGVSMSLTRTSGADFDVMDLSGGPGAFPLGWGRNCLSPFAADGTNDFFNANFSGATVTGVSIEYGDFGADDGFATFEIWSGADGTGTLLSSASVFWDGALHLGDLGTFTYSGVDAIGSFRFKGEGVDYPQSLYWDNLRAESSQLVPLPTAAGMGFAGLTLAGAKRRRR